MNMVGVDGVSGGAIKHCRRWVQVQESSTLE